VAGVNARFRDFLRASKIAPNRPSASSTPLFPAKIRFAVN
jgi:hypothetical protein